MQRTINEEKVLKKLNIENFRYLTKDHVLSIASMLDKMDPEVAKKALEQFPEFSKASICLIQEYRAICENILKDNCENNMSCYATIDASINACLKLLEEEHLTFENKSFILQKIFELNQLKIELEKQNKKFLGVFMLAAGTVAVGIVFSLSSVLGGKTTYSPKSQS